MKERPIIFSGPMVRAILDGRKTQTRRVVRPPAVEAIEFVGGRCDDEPMTVNDFTIEWMVSYDEDTRKKYPAQWCVRSAEYPEEGILPIGTAYGQPGDRLWVRETWNDVHPLQVAEGRYSQEGRAGIPGPRKVQYRTIYRADGEYPRIHFDHPDGTHVDDWPYRSVCTGEDCTRRHLHPEESYTGWMPSIHMPRWASRITLEVTGVRVERLQDITHDDAKAEGVTFIGIDDFNHITASEAMGFAQRQACPVGIESLLVWVIEFRLRERAG